MEKFEKVPSGILDKIGDNKKQFISKFVNDLEELFPETVKDGVVDFQALLDRFGEYEENGNIEKYNMTWMGKREAIREADEDIVGKTLKYVEEDSKNPETTQNLYIEGDNLEVLKLLRQSYYGKVKMIYIDPPYNTGNDFVYKDNFTMSEEEYAKLAGEIDEYGERLVKNSKDSGRFHSDWLNMMYPRLKVAKDLLPDDGVIFISIDDNEVYNMRKICDEIFGEKNFVNEISINMKNIAGASGGGEDKKFKKNIEYLIIYAKNYYELPIFNSTYEHTEIYSLIEQMREDDISWKYTSIMVKPGKKQYLTSAVDGSGNEIKIYKRINPEFLSVNQVAAREKISEKEAYYKYIDKIFRTTMPQSSIRPRVMEKVAQIGSIHDFYSIEYVPRSGKNKGELYEQFYKGQNFNLIAWLSDVTVKIDGIIYKKDLQGTYWDHTGGTKNLTKEGGIKFSNGKKPLSLLRNIVSLYPEKDILILDFFSGSATTAHAVMDVNAADNGNRKYIMVQLPENLNETLEKSTGDTKKNIKDLIGILEEINKPYYLTEIGKERIRRAGEQILEENKDKPGIENLDIGFKVFKVEDTNLKRVKDTVEEGIDLEKLKAICPKDSDDFNPHFTDIDVVYEMMLKRQDIELTEEVTKLDYIGDRTYLVGQAILVCLEEKINEEMIDKIGSIKPALSWIILRDSAFDSNINLKLNAVKRLRAVIKETNDKKDQKIYWI